MKSGRSLQQIAAELERQVQTRKDYIASQGVLEAKVVDGEVVIDGLNGEPKGITNFAHKQFADHLAIPARYYERMRATQPALLAANMNTWLHDETDEKRMLRTLDGKVRAFLSNKFRPLDNFDLADGGPAGVVQDERAGAERGVDGDPPLHQGDSPEPVRRTAGRDAVGSRARHGRAHGRLVSAVDDQQQRSRRGHAPDRAERVHDVVLEPCNHGAGGDEEVPHRPRLGSRRKTCPSIGTRPGRRTMRRSS